MKCDVIIPVGPGHEQIVNAAVTSVAMAAQYTMGPFNDVKVLLEDDTKGLVGRSRSRNNAVRKSDAAWVYYLDADDVVATDLFHSLTDYVHYSAVWGKFGEIDGVIIHDRFQTWGFDTYEALLNAAPHYAVKMGHFVRRDIALKYPFNVDMNAGEDWEYYLRIWKHERCIKIGGPTIYYKRRGMHSKGPKSATGRDWNISVDAQLEKARR